MRVPASAAGKKVRCPNCQEVTQVPAGQSPAYGSMSVQQNAVHQSPVAQSSGAQSPAQPTGVPAVGAPNPFGEMPAHFASTPSPAYHPPVGGFPAAAPRPAPPSQSLAGSSASAYDTPTSESRSRYLDGEDPPPAGTVLLILGIASLGTFGVMFLLAWIFPPIAIILGIAVYIAGGLGATVGSIWLLVIAFQDDITQGLLCLFVPFYILYYMFANWSETWFPALIYWVSTIVLISGIIGFVSGGVLFAMMNL